MSKQPVPQRHRRGALGPSAGSSLNLGSSSLGSPLRVASLDLAWRAEAFKVFGFSGRSTPKHKQVRGSEKQTCTSW